MNKTDLRYTGCINTLRDELLPAMGCTEPIAIAYAAACAAGLMQTPVERVEVHVSGSIIKNAKSVVVPNTGGQKGIPAAVAAGIVAGQAEKKLEVISAVKPEEIGQIAVFIENIPIEVRPSQTGMLFDIHVILYGANSWAAARLVGSHTNLVLLEKDGRILRQRPAKEREETGSMHGLTLRDIWEFVNHADFADLKAVLGRQVEYNSRIAEEGMQHDYGANVGRILMAEGGDSIRVRAKAMAAAGSDARMSGCELPVVINSGSGNQGIACSVPVIVYARELNAGEEKLYRALALSNLVSLYQKRGIGCLSAYCGAVSAGASAGAAIAYLHGGSFDDVSATLENALAIVSGMVCDGAKASCAAKIASAIEAGILGYSMCREGRRFLDGEGIVSSGVEATIRNISHLASVGMRATNDEVIRLMTKEES